MSFFDSDVIRRVFNSFSRKRIITLGTWDGQPIEWLVLKKDGFATLMISKYPLFSHCFNPNRNDENAWNNSSLRKYLNREFFNKAFTQEEKKQIVNAFLSEPNRTKDNVFVLTTSEAESLMTQDERKHGNGTGCNGHSCPDCYKYSEQHGTCWWTRTPYNNNNSVERILSNGDKGSYCVDIQLSIRPAIYIKEK